MNSSGKRTGNFFLLLTFLVCLNSCLPARIVWHNYADIGDYKIFPKRKLKAPVESYKIPLSSQNFNIEELVNKDKYKSASEFFNRSKTVAFIIIKKDSILYENYFNDYERESVVPSFSMAKSYISALTGIAIDDGLINSVNDPVTKYLPELKDNGFDRVTIEHLLQMNSGIEFNENYKNPFSEASTYYYGNDLRKQVAQLKIIHEPGTHFQYASGNTQLLALILEKVLKGKTVTEYLNEKIWQPLGMEYDATWSIDSKKSGLEKAFCCINARAIDFAKFGMLYYNNGKWNDKQIISEDWVKKINEQNKTEGNSFFYSYHWRKISPESKEYYAAGWLGQYIYVNPEKDIVIVRLGKNFGNVVWEDLLSIYSRLIK